MRTTISIVAASTLLLATCACGGSRSTPAGGDLTAAPAMTTTAVARATRQPHGAVYEVTSDAPTALAVSWRSWREGGSLGVQEYASGPALPLRRSVPLPDDVAGTLSFALEAQAAEGATTITCRIVVDGVVRAVRTSAGEFSVANCYVR
ncbi:MmpS family transport accessory protein [Tersicoccus sp. MR15.9]|uniref:MmpS family transport accessory protein n=1 Tax=Tersicoccus mangrovi TaxID=3121635 RepID=UPI002FE5D822